MGRQIALVGDAELDEGAVWEAIADPSVAKLGEVLWVVDLNRQSLDRVVPDIAFDRWAHMFEAAGWQTITVKYGSRLDGAVRARRRPELRKRIDAMPNEEYQRLLRAEPEELRERLPGARPASSPSWSASLADDELRAALRDLGGHDPAKLIEAYRAVDHDRPTVVFAYTIKGWSLPIEGHPENHSALLTRDQMLELAAGAGRRRRRALGRVRSGQPRGRAVRRRGDGARARRAGAGRRRRPCRRSWAARTAARSRPSRRSGASSPTSCTRRPRWPSAWSRSAPTWPARPTWAAGSTRWASGRWATGATGSPTIRRRSCTGTSRPRGRHFELGIAETNLVGLLGELGATWSRYGQPLLPIGTIYDPFVGRALEPWSFGMYAGGQSILVGTPSGVSLAPEGGAHQSIVTPSIGIAQPGCTAWEPAFGRDLEWTLLHALGAAGAPGRRERLLPPVHAPDRPGARRRPAARELVAGRRLLPAPAAGRRA